MDCIDRTNIVQSFLSNEVFQTIFQEKVIFLLFFFIINEEITCKCIFHEIYE